MSESHFRVPGFAWLYDLVQILRTTVKSTWAVWVGMRYLRSKKNSRFLSFITLLSVGGVAIGVTAMIIVLSVMDGFESQLKKRLGAGDLHVLITPTVTVDGFRQGFVPDTAISAETIKSWTKADLPIAGAWPVVATEAIFRLGSKVTGVVVKGVGTDRLERLKANVVERAESSMLLRADENGEKVPMPTLIVGQELANNLGVIPGDQVSLISPTETDGPMQAIPRMKKFVIEATYSIGVPEQELHTVYTSAQNVRAFLRRNSIVSSWEITARNIDDAPQIARAISPQLENFKVQTWMQLNAHLFASLQLERIAMFVILAFIVVVASFNIVTTLTLMVLEKTREISIIRAMGAQGNEVGAVFLAEGLLIGGVGIVLGNILGWVVCMSLSRWEFIKLPDIYYDTSLPVTFNGAYYAGISLIAFFIVIFACVFPARRAAALNPLDGIRFG